MGNLLLVACCVVACCLLLVVLLHCCTLFFCIVTCCVFCVVVCCMLRCCIVACCVVALLHVVLLHVALLHCCMLQCFFSFESVVHFGFRRLVIALHLFSFHHSKICSLFQKYISHITTYFHLSTNTSEPSFKGHNHYHRWQDMGVQTGEVVTGGGWFEESHGEKGPFAHPPQTNSFHLEELHG